MVGIFSGCVSRVVTALFVGNGLDRSVTAPRDPSWAFRLLICKTLFSHFGKHTQDDRGG